MKSKTLRLAFARHSLPHHEQFMALQTSKWTARRAAGHYDPAPPFTFN